MRRASALPLLLLLALPAGRTTETERPRLPVTPTRAGVASALPLPEARTAGEDPHLDAWVADELMVAPPPEVDLAELARAIGAEVVADAGRSGYGALRVRDVGKAMARLEALGAGTAPMGRTVGAGKKTAVVTAPAPRPPDLWHLGAMVLPSSPGDLSGWVVAVVDSGVAYETSPGHVKATGLANVAFVDPADFVEFDGHPNDDHQHGTHIASLIASRGWISGVAPGVTLMPIKVLDAANQGTEWALIEGIHHAIDHGADVINLSLSFPLGYVPSLALQDALSRAFDAGIVVVAAAGNDGAAELTWPAASRLVLAVGASSPSPGSQQPAPYTNMGPRLDVLAPGGNLASDRTGDTWVDGILAETIEPGDPSRLGYWFYQGTSQATALVSGAVVRLLAAGVPPEDVGPTLQAQAYAALGGSDVAKIDIEDALDHEKQRVDVLANVLPWLGQGLLGAVVPRARVAVVDGSGDPLSDCEVVVTATTASRTSWLVCRTDAEGRCDVSLPSTSTDDAWAFRVDTVNIDHVAQRPSKALFASDGAEVLLEALAASDLAYDALAVYWPRGLDPKLGLMAPSFAIVDAGVGAATSPMAVLLAESGVATSIELVALDLNGTGLLSSPLGFTTIRRLTLDGSGLLSSPLGVRRVTLAGIDGTGLLSSPLGFHATQLYTRGTGLLSSPLGLVSVGTAVRLDTGRAIGSSLDGTALQAMVDDELGLRTADGYEAAALVVATGAVEVGLRAASATNVAGGVPPVRWTP